MKVAASTIITLAALVLVSTAPSATTAGTMRVSVSSSQNQGDRPSWTAGISANGRYVAFTSQATNLVPGDTNDRQDAFVYDRRTGHTQRVSVSSSGAQAKPGPNPFGGSAAMDMSANGRYVLFRSDASNLVSRRCQRQERRLHPRPRDGKDAPHPAGRPRHHRRRAQRKRPLRRPRGGRQPVPLRPATRPPAPPDRGANSWSVGHRSVPTAATSRSRRTRRTSSAATRTSCRTSSSATCAPAEQRVSASRAQVSRASASGTRTGATPRRSAATAATSPSTRT